MMQAGHSSLFLLAVLSTLLLCVQAALSGLALPPLDVDAVQYGGAWASANSLVFLDLMKHSTPFLAGTRSNGSTSTFGWLGNEKIIWRPDGYPSGLTPTPGQQYCAATTIGAGGAYYSAGQYVVLFAGQGAVEVDGDAANNGLAPPSSSTGRLVINLTPSATGLRLRIVVSSPSSPVTYIRIVPLAFEANYTAQLYHPEFVRMLQGVPLLRFALWQRATGNSDSTRAAPRVWALRTTPTHSSQVREADGVCVEHLVQLANTLNASMWMSLPRAANSSDTYTAGMIAYVASHLTPGLALTLEFGTDGPGWLSGHLPTQTLLLAGIARREWAAAGRAAGMLRIAEVAPIINAVPNMLLNLGPNVSLIDAIALPASFGGMALWTSNLDNPTAWGDPNYFNRATPRPNMTLETVMKLVRSSVIAGDISYNKQFQILKSLGLAVLGYAAGPELQGPLYGARANYDRAVQSCPATATTTWPCTFNGPYPPWTGISGITWTNLTQRNLTLAGAMTFNASREAALESVMRQARSNATIYDIALDGLWRWHMQMGGGDVIMDVSRLARSCNGAPGMGAKAGFQPDECQDPSLVVARPTASPSYLALMAWLAGGRAGARGALPLSSSEAGLVVPAPTPCAPACVYGTCGNNGVCVCWAGASGAACGQLGVSPEQKTPSACNKRVGINLEGISDWSAGWTFVDVFKASRDWIPQTFSTGPWSSSQPIDLINTTAGVGGRAALGYPASLSTNQQVSTLVVRDLQGHVPGGVYTVLYDGVGLLDFSMYDVLAINQLAAGHVKVLFSPSTNMNNGILVSIVRTDPLNPLRNVRVYMPGFASAGEGGRQPFHPAFLSYLRPFGTLRFMDWMHSNNGVLPVTWDQRPRVEDRSYAVAAGGVPLEHMVLLANTLGVDPWFNMPFAADDTYITSFAQAVLASLRPDLKVHVEYSNEVWHTGFPGGQYAQAMGLKMNLTVLGAAWPGGATNEARFCFAALRTVNISRLWKAAWGSQASRVVAVVASQASWTLATDKLLSCHNAYQDFDAIAIAPYFGTYDRSRDTNLSTFLNVTLPGQIANGTAQVALHAAIAASYRLPLLAYEAGQGLIGDGTATDLAMQANRHPGMAALYLSYLSQLTSVNVSRVVHYSSTGAYSRYGSWGLMEWQDQDRREAPKYQGLMSYLTSSLTCALPLPPSPATCPGVVGCSGNGDCLPGGQCSCWSGFSGDDCSQAQYTEVYNCGYQCTFGQGVCNVSTTNAKIRTWGCSCKPGITGLTCSIVQCPSNCSGNGECIDQGVCSCYPGFRGPACSQDWGCGGHGSCSPDGTSTCVCDAGWRVVSGTCQWDCSDCQAGTTATCIGPNECGCASQCVSGDCIQGACHCWAGYGGATCNTTTPTGGADATTAFVPRVNRASLAGVNLAGLAYWSTEWVWLDVMKSSGAWLTANADDTSLQNPFDTQVTLELRPDGYPARLPLNTIAHKLLLRDVQLHAMSGRYVCLYDGEGRLDFGFDAQVVSRSKGRIEFLFTPTSNPSCAASGAAYCGDNGIHLLLLVTSPANPIHNIRLLPASAGGMWEGRSSRLPFHPWYLKSLARYSLIRFMAWQDVNRNTSWSKPIVTRDSMTSSGGSSSSSSSVAWLKRTIPSQDTQARPGLGAALEHMVQLVNLLGAAPWFNVHHLADDGYVLAMATLLRDTLRPDIQVYIEHSNEVWNQGFPQYAFASAQGLALNLSSDPRIAAYRYHAWRTVAIATIFRNVFAAGVGGGSSGGGADRVKVVLGGWGFICNGGSGCGAEVMRETMGWNGTALKVNYFGVTAYWDCGLGSNGVVDNLLTVQQMVAQCNATLGAAVAASLAVATAAAPFGVPLITYEAGPSIVEASAIASGSITPGLMSKFIAVNRDPDMYRLYSLYLDAYWKQGLVAAGRPWMQFVSTAQPSQYGSWGLQEYTGQTASEAPKYRALMDWLDLRADQGAASNATGPTGLLQQRRALCLSLDVGVQGGVAGTAGGGVWLGEGMLLGAPAVQQPIASQVLLQGHTYLVSWLSGLANASSQPLDITLWQSTDCTNTSTQQLQRPVTQALLVLAARAVPVSPPGQLAWRVPLPEENPALSALVATSPQKPSFFLRISDGLTTNYSEPFSIQAPYAYVTGAWIKPECKVSANHIYVYMCTRTLACMSSAFSTPALVTSSTPNPTCGIFPGWNLSMQYGGDASCMIDAGGCRDFRTSNVGGWLYSNFKPVQDCVAQSSPWPLAGKAAAVAVALSLCPTTQPAVQEPCMCSPPKSPPPKPPSPPLPSPLAIGLAATSPSTLPLTSTSPPALPLTATSPPTLPLTVTSSPAIPLTATLPSALPLTAPSPPAIPVAAPFPRAIPSPATSPLALPSTATSPPTMLMTSTSPPSPPLTATSPPATPLTTTSPPAIALAATSPPAIPSPATSPSALYQTSMDLVLHAVDVEALTSSPAAKKALLQAIATATSIPLADLTLAAISFPVDATLKLTGVSLLAPATTQLLSTLQAALAKVLGLSQSEVDVQLVAASALMSSRRLSAEVKVAGSRQLLQGTGDVSVSLRVLGISSQPGSSTQLMVSLTTALEQGGGLATELLQQAGSGGIGSFIVSTPPAVVAVVRVSGPEMVLANSQAWAAAASEAMTSGAMADALLASPELAGATATMDQMTMAMVGLPPPLDPQPASSTDASASPSTTVGGAPSTSTSTSAVAPWVVAVASVCGALVLALIVVATVALVASHRKRRGVISPRCHSVTGGHRVFPLQMEDDISKAKL